MTGNDHISDIILQFYQTNRPGVDAGSLDLQNNTHRIIRSSSETNRMVGGIVLQDQDWVSSSMLVLVICRDGLHRNLCDQERRFDLKGNKDRDKTIIKDK